MSQLYARTQCLIGQTLRSYGLVARSASSFVNKDCHVELTDDGNAFVCVHPEQNFPYEHTKPIELKEAKKVDSVLRVQYEKKDLMPAKDCSDEELMQLTYTSKEFWRPNNEWKKKYNKQKKEREGL